MLIEDITDNNKPATFLEKVKSTLTERAIAEVKSPEFRKQVMNESEEIHIGSMEDLTEDQKAEIIEGINESADIKESLSSLNEDVNEAEIELESGETLVVSESVVNELLAEAKNEKYNKVFRAIAKHCKLDPEKIDDASEEKQKKFYDYLDKCWDADKDEVPDSCPVDLGMNESLNEASAHWNVEFSAGEYKGGPNNIVFDRDETVAVSARNAQEAAEKAIEQMGYSKEDIGLVDYSATRSDR